MHLMVCSYDLNIKLLTPGHQHIALCRLQCVYHNTRHYIIEGGLHW